VTLAVILIVKTYRRQATTGKEELTGKIAQVQEKLDPEGTVSYLGEIWNAVSDSGVITSGEEVIITKVNGLKLTVSKKTKE